MVRGIWPSVFSGKQKWKDKNPLAIEIIELLFYCYFNYALHARVVYCENSSVPQWYSGKMRFQIRPSFEFASASVHVRDYKRWVSQ